MLNFMRFFLSYSLLRCTITKNGRYRYLWPWERRDESQVAVVFAQMSVFLSANQNKFLMLKAMLQRCEIDRNTYIDKKNTYFQSFDHVFVTYKSLHHGINAALKPAKNTQYCHTKNVKFKTEGGPK